MAVARGFFRLLSKPPWWRRAGTRGVERLGGAVDLLTKTKPADVTEAFVKDLEPTVRKGLMHYARKKPFKVMYEPGRESGVWEGGQRVMRFGQRPGSRVHETHHVLADTVPIAPHYNDPIWQAASPKLRRWAKGHWPHYERQYPGEETGMWAEEIAAKVQDPRQLTQAPELLEGLLESPAVIKLVSSLQRAHHNIPTGARTPIEKGVESAVRKRSIDIFRKVKKPAAGRPIIKVPERVPGEEALKKITGGAWKPEKGAKVLTSKQLGHREGVETLKTYYSTKTPLLGALEGTAINDDVVQAAKMSLKETGLSTKELKNLVYEGVWFDNLPHFTLMKAGHPMNGHTMNPGKLLEGWTLGEPPIKALRITVGKRRGVPSKEAKPIIVPGRPGEHHMDIYKRLPGDLQDMYIEDGLMKKGKFVKLVTKGEPTKEAILMKKIEELNKEIAAGVDSDTIKTAMRAVTAFRKDDKKAMDVAFKELQAKGYKNEEIMTISKAVDDILKKLSTK